VHPVGRLAELLSRSGDDVGFKEGIDLFTALPEVIASVLACFKRVVSSQSREPWLTGVYCTVALSSNWATTDELGSSSRKIKS
jgi:hypothetical protein